MKHYSSYSQQKTTYIKIITILLALSLVMMLFGCGKSNNIDDQVPSEQSASSAYDNQDGWNKAFKQLFHIDSKTATQFADMLHEINQTEGAVTLLQTLNNGKVMYVAFELDSMAVSLPNSMHGEKLYVSDCLFIRGNQPAEELIGLSKEEITAKYSGELFYGSKSVNVGDPADGKITTVVGSAVKLSSSSTFTGDITLVVTDIGYEKADGIQEHVTTDNFIFHITESSDRLAIEQPIMQDDQVVGNFRLTELNLQISLLHPEMAEELADALTAPPNSISVPSVKLLDKNNQVIDCRIGSTGRSQGSIITCDFSFNNLVDTSEVSGIQVGDYVIKVDQ